MKMKASTLLMAAVLLVAAAAAPLNNLNVVFDEIPKVNQTFMQVGGANPPAAPPTPIPTTTLYPLY